MIYLARHPTERSNLRLSVADALQLMIMSGMFVISFIGLVVELIKFKSKK